MIALLVVLLLAVGWSAYDTDQRGFNDPTPGRVPWEQVTVTNYRAAYVDYDEPDSLLERDYPDLPVLPDVPDLSFLDELGDSDTYAAATRDRRIFIVPCDNPPPAGTPGS